MIGFRVQDKLKIKSSLIDRLIVNIAQYDKSLPERRKHWQIDQNWANFWQIILRTKILSRWTICFSTQWSSIQYLIIIAWDSRYSASATWTSLRDYFISQPSCWTSFGFIYRFIYSSTIQRCTKSTPSCSSKSIIAFSFINSHLHHKCHVLLDDYNWRFLWWLSWRLEFSLVYCRCCRFIRYSVCISFSLQYFNRLSHAKPFKIVYQ